MAAQIDENVSILIVHPAGQDVTLSYSGLRHAFINETSGWMIDQIPYGVGALAGGILDGRYSANQFSNNLIIKNVTANDDRSGTWYQCVIIRPVEYHYDEVVEYGNITILYVAGE